MKINHNVSALRINHNLKGVNQEMDASFERMSTGLRINRAGDDALGFAVSEKMRTQIRGLAQAERNVMDGISFIQVTEGGLSQVNDILQRLRELSVQTSNGIYSNEDREMVSLEVNQLIDEVDRIGKSATFNQMKPLNGDYSPTSKNPFVLQVGPNQNEKTEIYIGTMNATALRLQQGGRNQAVSTPVSSNEMIGIVDQAIQKINRQRADLGAYQNRLQITATGLENNYINMVDAESTIRDADMAEEVVGLTRSKILTESNVALLSQANFRSEQVVKLLNHR